MSCRCASLDGWVDSTSGLRCWSVDWRGAVGWVEPFGPGVSGRVEPLGPGVSGWMEPLCPGVSGWMESLCPDVSGWMESLCPGVSGWGSQGPGCGLGVSPAVLSDPGGLCLSPGASLTERPVLSLLSQLLHLLCQGA